MPTSARRAWRAMSQVALDRDRKIAVSEALGLSWTRVLALRQLATQSHTLRVLAQRLSADPPYVTLMVYDLEERGLVRRMPHPEDRRAKLVELTAAGRIAVGHAPMRSSTSRRLSCVTCLPRTSLPCCVCSNASSVERRSCDGLIPQGACSISPARKTAHRRSRPAFADRTGK